ncbi:MAG: gliding motility-associated C-terminal domain-containing protein, partial [Saprospiraceae bacterium]
IRCFGEDNGALVINSVIGGIPDYTYTWSVTPQNVTSLSSLAPGSYNLTVTDANGCSFTTIFTLTEPLQLMLDLGPNQTVAVDDSVKIDLATNASPTSISDIQWSGYDGLDCPCCPSLEFIATSSATFTALLTDTAGCIVSDSMRLTVLVPKIIYIPTVFSPNDDGTNDFFSISGRRNLEKIEYLRIFDRWGNLVFDKANLEPNVEEEGWDGTFNGDPMSPGVYVFISKLIYEDTSSETVKGSITLIR